MPARCRRIIAPTTNSYKRLVPGYEAPVNLAYSRRNRSAAVPHPDVLVQSQGQARRVPAARSCRANPYLAFAAMLMAGLDGVLNKIDPGEPLDKDIYDLSPEELRNVPSMPGSLEEALTCLEDDHSFLLKGDVFTEELIETFIDYKRKNEADAVRLRPASVRVRAVLRHLEFTAETQRAQRSPVGAPVRPLWLSG